MRLKLRLRRGLSFAELLVTMAIIGLLARIAVPRYGEMKRRAIAASIMGDLHAIRIAAFTYYTERGAFPPDAASGQLPVQLVDNLPSGFTFDRTDYEYDWHVWSATNGAGNPEIHVGITIFVNDPRLSAQLVLTAGSGYIPVVTPNQVTFLVANAS